MAWLELELRTLELNRSVCVLLKTKKCFVSHGLTPPRMQMSMSELIKDRPDRCKDLQINLSSDVPNNFPEGRVLNRPCIIIINLFCFLQVCVKGYYQSLSRCTKCPTLPWLITQMILIVCAVFLFVFILVRDDRKAKSKARTLSDVVLARLKIIVGFYQVFHGLVSF